MPIRRHHRWFYPLDWRQLSQWVRFTRAHGRCEQCGRPHGRQVVHLGDGRWWDEEALCWRSGAGRALTALPPPADNATALTTKVVLAAAHLDYDPTNNRPTNLRAYCQRCHMLHDKPEHLRQRHLTYRKRKALGDLFTGRY